MLKYVNQGPNKIQLIDYWQWSSMPQFLYCKAERITTGYFVYNNNEKKNLNSDGQQCHQY
jgi:hypothetical protein